MAAIGQNRLVNVVQGTGPRGILANLYFDQQSGLLLRVVRYGRSPIGRVPTQVDYGDYREVSGIKMPFHMVFAWMDGRDAIQLSEIQINISIDASKFAPPPDAPQAAGKNEAPWRHRRFTMFREPGMMTLKG